MKEPEIPSNEAERMELVRQLNVLDTDSEEVYDGIAYLTALICNMPVSTITIVDKDRQWFKSALGIEAKQTPRCFSFCGHTILGKDILEVEDSQKDERFKDNPLVTGDPHVRFYAGAPLELHNGLRVGALCVIDHKPNKLSDQQLKALHFLSLQVSQLLELRLKIREIEILREKDAHLVRVLTHELRNPLTSISGYLSLATLQIKKENQENIEKCQKNVDRMLHIVNEFLNYSQWKGGFWELQKKDNDINDCILESVTLLKGYLEKCKVSVELNLDEKIPKSRFDYVSILSALENLISNAAKYSPEKGKIILSSERLDHAIKVCVQDFGSGIAVKDHDKIFKPFALHNNINKAGISSSGLGLSIVKKIIDKHGGTLAFESNENQGSLFYFTLPF